MKYRILLVFALTLSILITAPAFAQNSNSSNAQPQILTEDEAYQRDAAEYVKAFGGTVDEAVRRLKLQNVIAELEETLRIQEEDTFAGLWIEHTPRFRVVVQLTQGNKDDILPYIQNESLADIVEVQIASVSYEQLQATHLDLIQTIEMLGIQAESGINVQENRIEVYVTDRTQFESALLTTNKQFAANIEIVEVDSLSAPLKNWYGGLSLSLCTTGLSVKNSSGQKFTTSAGHCDNSATSPLTSYFRVTGGAYDFVILNTPAGDVVKNWAADNVNDSTPYYRIISSYTPRGSVGTLVCKYGKTTKYTCGTIEQNNYNYQNSPTWILVNSTSSTVKIACPGDSGAAWILAAQGMAFMPQDGAI